MDKSIELTKKLIEIESVSGNEGKILDFLSNFLKENSVNDVWQTNDFVAGVFKGAEKARKAVILTGHIDTVSAGDLKDWETSPWQVAEDGDKIIGLGASDMKSGLAASFTAGIDFWDENSTNADFDLWLVAVSNEEIDGSGSAAFCQWFKEHGFNYSEIYGIIPEPTNNSQIEVGHRGNRFVRFNFSGISGHASQQDNFEKSALAKASIFLNNLSEIYEAMKSVYSNEILGLPSIVATSLSSGSPESPNKTAASASLVVDFRTTPELDKDFENFANQLSEKYDATWEYHSSPAPSCLISKDSKIITSLLESSELNKDAITISPGATDQAFFVNELNAQIVVFGPGEFSEAHHQNEFAYKHKVKDFYKTCRKFLNKI